MAEEIFNQSTEGTKQLQSANAGIQAEFANDEVQVKANPVPRFTPITRNTDGSFNISKEVFDLSEKDRYTPLTRNEDGNFTIARVDKNEDFTGIMDLQREQIKLNEEAFDDTSSPHPSTIRQEFVAMIEKQSVFLGLLANGYGLVSDEDILDFTIARSNALHNAQINAPEYVKKFNKEFEEANGFYEAGAVMISNPRAMGRVIVTQAPNSILPLMAGLAGSAAGTFAIPIPFVGSLLGFAAGTFVGGSMVEIGAWMDQQIQAKGVDMTDRDQLLNLLQDDKFMKNLIREAERKGLSTAAVDTLFTLFGGRLLSGAGKSIIKKVLRGVGEIGIESTGEGISDAAGVAAAIGIENVSAKNSFLEAVAGLGQSTGQAAFTSSLALSKKAKTGTKSVKKMVTETDKLNKGLGDIRLDAEAQSFIDNDGGSFNAYGESFAGTKNIAVSIFPELSEVREGKLSFDEIRGEIKDFREKYGGILKTHPNLALGTFFSDPAKIDENGKAGSNQTFIDLSVIVPKSNLQTALDLGKKFNQESVFDLETFKTIDTGSTGKDTGKAASLESKLEKVQELRGDGKGDLTKEAKKFDTVEEFIASQDPNISKLDYGNFAQIEGTNVTVTVTKSAKEGERNVFQVTTFSKDLKPLGDFQAETFEEALVRAKDEAGIIDESIGLSKDEINELVKDGFIEKEDLSNVEQEFLNKGKSKIELAEIFKKAKESKDTPKAKVLPKLEGLASEVIPLSTQTTVNRKDVSGRITKLDTDIRQLDKDIDNLQAKQESSFTAAEKILQLEINNLEKEITTNKKANRKTSTLEQRLEKKQLALITLRGEAQNVTDNALIKALAERDILDEERASLITAEDLTKVDVSGKRVDLSANEVSAMQVQIVKNKIRDIVNGIRKGKQIARAEIKDIQNSLTGIILKSEVNDTSKKNALKAIQKIQTEAQFDKAAPKLVEMLDTAAEKFAKRKLIDSFKKMTKAKGLDKLSPEVKKQVEAILDEFSATKPSGKKVVELQALADQLIAHDSNILSGEQIHALNSLQKVPLSDMPLEDVQMVHDSVAHLLKINEDQDTIRVENRRMKKEEVIAEATNNIKKKFGELDGNVDGMDSTQIKKEGSLAAGIKWLKTFIGVESYNMEMNAEILDGEDGGIIMKILYNGIDEGESRKLAFEHAAEDFFVNKNVRGILDEGFSQFFTKEVGNKDKVKVKISSGTITMTKGERISFLNYAKNENARRHLTEGGFVFRATPDAAPITLTDEDLTLIEQSATSGEVSIANMMHEYFNTIQKQSINAVSVPLLGFEIAIEPNYFPLSVDRNALDREEQVQSFENTGAFTQITIEGQGIFKKRVKSGKPIYISDAFEVTRDNIQKASAYIGFAEPLRNAKSLVNSGEFQKSLRKAGLKSYLKVIQKYLMRVEGESVRNDNADMLTQGWINKLDVAVLGGNPYIWIKQPVSYLLAATEIDIKYLASSFSFNLSKAEEAEIIKWSPPFRDRFLGNISRETGEVASVGRTRKFWLGKEVISQKLMQPLRKFDKAAIGSIWRATKKEVAQTHPNLKGDAFSEKVAERAWVIARRTQPTFSIKDRSTIGMTKNTWLRLATKYSSQRNKNWMIMRRAFEVYNRTKGTVSDNQRMKTLSKKMLLIRVIAPLLIAGINALAATGRRDEGEDKEKALSEFVFEYFKTTLGDIFIVSPIIGEILGQIEKGKGRGFGLTDPLTGELESIISLTATLYKAIEETVSDDNYRHNNRKRGQAEWKAGLPNWFLDSLDVSSKVTGMPASGYLRFLLKTRNQIDKALEWSDNSDKVGNARFK